MSKQEELEARIKEQRTVEANQKGLTGQNGKIGVVLRVFGQPIIGHSLGGAYVDTNYIQTSPLEDDHDPRNSSDLMKSIPTMEMDGTIRPSSEEWSELDEPLSYGTYNVGWYFDGLGRGMHMEILYKEDKSEFVLYYKGNLVYKEIMGELLCYVPGEEWEKWIEGLSKSARDVMRKKKEEEFAEKIKSSEKAKISWWESMKSRWGVT